MNPARRGALAGAILGCLEAALAPQPAALGMLASAALLIPVGAVTAVLLSAVRARAPRLGMGAAPWARSPHLFAFCATLACSLVLAAALLAFPALLTLQDAQLAVELLASAALLSVLGVPLLTFVLARVLGPLLTRIPWPATLARLSPWVLPQLVALALCLVFLARTRAVLSGLALAPAALSLLLLLGLLTASRPASGATMRRVVLRELAVAVAGGLFASAGLMALQSNVASAITATAMPARVAATLAAATDLDGDGHGALFGGRDCAPLDGARHPTAVDLPDNGIDENCDGRDHSVRAAEGAPGEGSGWAVDAALVRPYNVVLIVIDALRADYLGRKRKRLAVTPALDRLARESLVFTRAFSQSPSTSITFPSLLTGHNPLQLRWGFRKGIPQMHADHVPLAERFARLKYRRGLVTNRWIRWKMPWIKRGYDKIGDYWNNQPYREARVASAPRATAHAIEFLEDALRPKKPKPFFLTVYYEDPHAPYSRHDSRGMPMPGSKPIDRYAGEVRYADHHVGFLLDYLRAKRGVWKDTVVIVTADHGEEFGEHGGHYHDRTCYTESVHVPLLLRIPGVERARIEAPVALVDIVPTLLELVGDQAPRDIDGVSLLQTRHSPALGAARPIHCAHFRGDKPDKLTRAVRLGDWGLFQTPEATELYDIKRDRKEKQNLAGDPAHAERQREVAAALQAGGTRVLR